MHRIVVIALERDDLGLTPVQPHRGIESDHDRDDIGELPPGEMPTDRRDVS